MKTSLNDIQPYSTRDGSLIRELMHPEKHDCRKMSFAQASIKPGQTTLLHMHEKSEEIYHITTGSGIMTLGNRRFAIQSGDTICIYPGTSHRVENTGKDVLQILCCCAPPYAHSDTKII